MRSYYDIAPDVELDVGVAYVDDIEVFGIDGYWRTDVRLGWRPRPSLEFVVGVQNAFDSHHAEYGSDFFTTPFEIERSAYALVRWRP